MSRRRPRLMLPLRAAFVSALLGGLAAGHAVAADLLPSFPAVEPASAPATFRLKGGFTMDLLAAEPLVSSPVAVVYDEDGAAYVAEMRDYPYTDKATHQAWKDNTTDAPIGRIRKLIDRDGDGRFDESYIFAEGLSWPSGLCVWRGGLIVTATPEILYLKDTDGDHRADERRILVSGFRKYNVQALMNSPLWGLDNRVTVTGGTNGGQLRRPGEERPPLRFARHDLRIDPRDGTFEIIAGGARFGHTADDWGNRFLCNIRNPAQHVVFDGTRAVRNPLLVAPNPVHDARTPGDTLPVGRISPIEPWRELRARRWTAEGSTLPKSELVAGGVFTSAAGITVYRGAAYPAEYYGQVFVAEVANNLVQRQTIAKDGVTFRIEAADRETEFLASTDLWFRPVNLVNAPDGTLHVIDMYRETIEHPWSIPDDIHARLDLQSGRDRGRIYRLAPPGFKVPKPPRLGSASTAELVATLSNPNSWWRETAQRLLFERQDAAAVPALRALLQGAPGDLTRLPAVWTLDGLAALTEPDLLRALADPSPGLREHAVRLAEPRLAGSAVLRDRIVALAQDAEIRVRYQVAFVAAGMADPRARDVAIAVLRRDVGDKWVRAAALSGAPAGALELARSILADAAIFAQRDATEAVRSLAFMIGAQAKGDGIAALVEAWSAAARAAEARDALWTGLGDGLRQASRPLRALLADHPAAARAADGVLAAAARTAADVSRPEGERVAAVRLVALDDLSRARPILAARLSETAVPTLQSAALKALAGYASTDVVGDLVSSWARFSPAQREESLVALLARRDRAGPVLSAIESGKIAAGQLSLARRNQLLAHIDPAIKTRAERLFGAKAVSARADVVASYQAQLGLRGDSARGAAVFEQVCAACHRFAGRGTELGPNLETVRGWDREKLLLAILDPNREVAPAYLAYTVELADGSSVSGLITEETPGSLKLRRIGGPEETILRQNIRSLSGATASLMPEGLEGAISPAAMADLLSFLSAP